jgi:TrmH family RNA methyltransferase
MIGDIITSIDNAMVKEARSLNDKKFRRYYGKFLIDGEKLVNEAVCGAIEIDKIFVDATKISSFDYILGNFDGRVVPVTEKVIASISENVTPQGIIAEVIMPETVEFNPEKNEPFLILDRLQDPGNLGTIIRTAAATGYSTIVLIDTVDAYSPKVIRSSSGGILYLDIYRMTEDEIVSYCLKNDIEMLVADMDGVNIFNADVANYAKNLHS